MGWNLAVVSVLVLVLVLWIAIKFARAVQREINAANKKAAEGKKKRSSYHWVFGSFHWIWAGIIPVAKYIYREWKTAPPDSTEKFLWTMLLAATGAVAIWIVMKILDRIINKEPKPVTQTDSARMR